MKLLCLCSGLTTILSISVSCGRPIDTSTTCGTILHTSTPLMTLWRTIAVHQSTELDILFCATWTLWVSVQRSDCIAKCCFFVFFHQAYSLSWWNVYTIIILITTKLCLPLKFRSLSETFVRRRCSILLPVLAGVVMWHGKKSVVHVARCIAALVPVHRTPSLLSDVHCFLNPSGTCIRLPIQDCRFWPVDYMITWLLVVPLLTPWRERHLAYVLCC